MDLATRSAEAGDLAEVARIASSMTLRPGQTPPDGGFLVLGYDLPKFLSRMDSGALFWVAEHRGRIVGFVYAELLENTIDREMAVTADDLGVSPAAVVKQVGVLPDWQRSGVGAGLYRAMFSSLPERTFLVAVVTDPPNSASLAFHERMGFVGQAPFLREDGLSRLLLVRPAAPPSR